LATGTGAFLIRSPEAFLFGAGFYDYYYD